MIYLLTTLSIILLLWLSYRAGEHKGFEDGVKNGITQGYELKERQLQKAPDN